MRKNNVTVTTLIEKRNTVASEKTNTSLSSDVAPRRRRNFILVPMLSPKTGRDRPGIFGDLVLGD